MSYRGSLRVAAGGWQAVGSATGGPPGGLCGLIGRRDGPHVRCRTLALNGLLMGAEWR